MEYTSNQRAAIFLVARWTNKLKNNMPIGIITNSNISYICY